MMHFHAKRFLSAYLDDALDEKTRVAVGGHLKKCYRCQKMYTALKQSSELIRSARDSIGESLPIIRHRTSNGNTVRFIPRSYGWAAAAITILVVSGLLLFQNNIIRPAIDPEGAVYLDLLLQEAANSGSSPKLLTTPYAALAQSPSELMRLTGNKYSEPALPAAFQFRRGFVYDKYFGGATGRIYVSDEDGKILCLFEQSIETKMAYGAGNSEEQTFLGRQCIEVLWPSLRLLSCESGDKRILLLSNVSTTQLESAFRNYPDLQPVH